MDLDLALNVSLELTLWLIYTFLIAYLCFYIRRKLHQHKVQRYYKVSSSSTTGVDFETRSDAVKQYLSSHVSLCSDRCKADTRNRQNSKKFLISQLSNNRTYDLEDSDLIGNAATEEHCTEQGTHLKTISSIEDSVLDKRIHWTELQIESKFNSPLTSRSNLPMLTFGHGRASSTSDVFVSPYSKKIKNGFFIASPTLSSHNKTVLKRLFWIIFLLLTAYFMTVLSAIFIYRCAEFVFLYSDAVPCPNITFDQNAKNYNNSKISSFSVDDLEKCQYFFKDMTNVTYKDEFVTVENNIDMITLHAWWISGLQSGSYYNSNITVLYTHGNVDNLSYYKNLYEFLAKLGISVFTWDYPGYGRSGGLPSEALILRSSETIMQHLFDNHFVNPQNLILWGYSLGGSVVANLAKKYPNVKGFVMQAPIDSAADVIRSSLPLTGWSLWSVLTQHYDTKSQMESIHSCLFQFVGDKDETFPVTRAQALFQRAHKADKRCKQFVVIPGLSHLEDPLESQEFQHQIVDYIVKVLKVNRH